MKAIWNNKVIAEAYKSDLIYIEGNWYFPPDSIHKQFFKPSDQRTTCFWKGEANYYDVEVDGDINEGAAWYYPQPKDGSIERVKKDFSNYVAFWRGVQVEE
ncbi:DUF427 domain-containing protein [Candidatus Saccharibacteria bacterium]|nr:DUF427 domain-containing protein [Candidatus Saccharibacteria bacterium]